MVTWGAVKDAPEQGAFILTLDSSPRYLHSSWERSATQFSWASFLSGFGFQFRTARLPQCFRTLSASIIPVYSQKYIDLRFVPLRFSRPCLRPPLLPGFYPHSRGATWARCTLGFDLKPGPITSVTGPGCLGAAICLAISRDLALARSHPNKASGCRCCKPFR